MLSFKSYAKINIFLKIVGHKDNYHEIKSRFIKYDNLFDKFDFIKKDKPKEKFELLGEFNCEMQKNTIYKAYKYLKKYTKSEKIDNFFTHYSLHVEKNIPFGSGLGGGSSNAAVMLLVLNKELKLNIPFNILLEIGKQIGSDVNFFLHDVRFANVSGRGDIVEYFNDDECKLDIITPKIHVDTALVFKTFRKNFFNKIDFKLAEKMLNLKTTQLLSNYEPFELNDLLRSALICYDKLNDFTNDKHFLSGSGSTFFKVKDND